MAQAPSRKTRVTQPGGVFDVSGGFGGGIVGGPFDNTFSKNTPAPVSTGNLPARSNPLSNMSPRGDVPTPPPARVGYQSPEEAEKGLISAAGGLGNLTEAQLRAIRQASALVPNLAKSQPSGDIASSSQMVTDKRRQEAERAAISAIQPSQEEVNPDQAYFDFMRDNMFQSAESAMSLAQQIGERTMESLNLRYDVALAENNAFYADAIQSLQQEAERAQGVADQLYSSLNPYSNSTQASGAKTYKENIRQTYIGKEQKLRQEAKRAEQAIQANDREALNEAMNAMQIAISDANSELNASLRSLQSEAFNASITREKMAQDESQFERSLANTELNQQQDNFRQYLTSGLVPSTEEIDRMIEDGSIYDHPVFSAGAQLYNPEGVINLMKNVASGIEDERAFELRLKNMSLNASASAQARLTKEQQALTARQSVASVFEQFTMSGVSPTSPIAILSAASASAGGITPTATIQKSLGSSGSIITTLNRAVAQTEAIKNKGQIRATIENWIGNDPDINLQEATLNELMPKIARGLFGEVGNLTEQEQSRAGRATALRVGSKLNLVNTDPETVRKTIRILAEEVVNAKMLSMQDAMNSGYDVSVYRYGIEELVSRFGDEASLVSVINTDSILNTPKDPADMTNEDKIAEAFLNASRGN